MMITTENFDKFEKSYKKALENKSDSSVFEGVEVLTAYAKHVVEYFHSTVVKIPDAHGGNKK